LRNTFLLDPIQGTKPQSGNKNGVPLSEQRVAGKATEELREDNFPRTVRKFYVVITHMSPSFTWDNSPTKEFCSVLKMRKHKVEVSRVIGRGEVWCPPSSHEITQASPRQMQAILN